MQVTKQSHGDPLNFASFISRPSGVEYTVSKLRPLTDVLGYVVFEENRNEELYLPYWNLSSRVLNSMILARQYFAGFYFRNFNEKRALNFAIQAFSTSFYFSKSLNFLKFLDKLEKGI